MYIHIISLYLSSPLCFLWLQPTTAWAPTNAAVLLGCKTSMLSQQNWK